MRRLLSGAILAALVCAGCAAVPVKPVTAPAAVIAGMVLSEPRRARTWALIGVVLVAMAGLALWRASLPGQLGVVSPRPATFDAVPLALSTTCMILLPAALVGFLFHRAIKAHLFYPVPVAAALFLGCDKNRQLLICRPAARS